MFKFSFLNIFGTKNIFDTFKVCLFCNKLCGYVYFTVKTDVHESFSSTTSALDIAVFVASLTFACYLLFLVLQAPLILSSTSIIMELGLFLFAKFVAINKIIIILLNFYQRQEWFQIFNNFNWIDTKV